MWVVDATCTLNFFRIFKILGEIQNNSSCLNRELCERTIVDFELILCVGVQNRYKGWDILIVGMCKNMIHTILFSKVCKIMLEKQKKKLKIMRIILISIILINSMKNKKNKMILNFILKTFSLWQNFKNNFVEILS